MTIFICQREKQNEVPALISAWSHSKKVTEQSHGGPQACLTNLPLPVTKAPCEKLGQLET